MVSLAASFNPKTKKGLHDRLSRLCKCAGLVFRLLVIQRRHLTLLLLLVVICVYSASSIRLHQRCWGKDSRAYSPVGLGRCMLGVCCGMFSAQGSS